MIKINNNIPLNKKDLIELLNRILEKDDFWARNTTIRYIEAKQEKLFKEVDRLLEEQRNLDIKKSDKLKRWIEIQSEIEVIYKTIDNLGEGWKYESV